MSNYVMKPGPSQRGPIKRSRSWLLRWGAVAALALSPLLATGCSDDGGEGNNGQDAAVNPDAGDVSESDGTSGNNNTTPEPEDYFISYVMQDKTGGGSSLNVYSTADGTHTQVSPEGFSCVLGCWLSSDMSNFVWVESNEAGGTVDIYAATVSDLTANDDGQLIAEGVSKPAVAGNVVTYRRESGGQYSAYYVSLDGGSETAIGGLGSQQTTLGGWHIDPASNQGMIFSPNLQTMDLRFGSLDGTITDTAYTVDAENYQQTSGSYFGESMPVAFSRDGKVAAFVTEAPNDYGECESASDCSGPVQRCGHQGRCTAIEVTVHFVDLENLGDLGGACGGPGTCGDILECYQPGADTTTARCIPKRVVVGMPTTPTQEPTPGATKQGGCELTEGNADYQYTKIRGPLSFDKGGNLYAVGTRDCNSGDAGDSDILKFDPASGEYEVVWGNPDTGYDPDLCWNNDSNPPGPDDAQCVPYITSARVSPKGNEVAFLATNPGVAEGRLAPDTMDLWTVLRNGEDHAWVGGHDSVLKHVTRMYVHSPQ